MSGLRALVATLVSLVLASPIFADTTLINGRPALPGEYPEIIYISTGRSRCSATVVGEHTILTAGHCVADGGVIQPVEFVVEQTVYKAVCKQHPLYRAPQKEDMDLALCKTDIAIKTKYASISKKGPALKEKVILTGYGCRKEGGTGGNDGVLYVGTSTVTRLPAGSNNWFYTENDSALCFGDSGSSSLAKMDDPKTEHHYVIGVNSRGDIKKLSLLAATYIEKAQNWFAEYAQEENVQICGVNKECDDGEGEPIPECGDELAKVLESYKVAGLALDELNQCLKKLPNLPTLPTLPYGN